jgi:lipid II:glycine glycyltransferase (peptidoglycan interpeptide bridge formation enzyme)
MNLLKWQSILHFRKLGVKRFNLVGVRINPAKGSKQEGLYNSKKRFGGQLLQGYMWKYPLNPLKYAVYSVAVRVQRGGDIVDQERHRRLDTSEVV